MWLLFAGLHEDPLTRGIMFDYRGVYKRQGAAVFSDRWLMNVPDNYDHRDAQIRRRRFVTACHETGHCFNLIHSWEKPVRAGGPWEASPLR
jgi:predicted Zn-dependent protease